MRDLSHPIVFLSVFKSGTVMMRRIIEDLTGLPFFEPPIVPGKVNYQDPEQLIIEPEHFYSWHLFPIAQVCQRLVAMQARPIFLLRNIYDLPVSMYYHFANNIDVEIGRGRNVDHYFRGLSKEDGLAAIISGLEKVDFRWQGVGPHYHHMELMLDFAQHYPCFVTTYERISTSKTDEVVRLAKFLHIDLDSQTVATIEHNSHFDVMKQTALANQAGSHFRKGRAGSHASELGSTHIQLVAEQMELHARQLTPLVAKANLPEILQLDQTLNGF